MIIQTWGEFAYFCLAMYGAWTVGAKFQKWVNS